MLIYGQQQGGPEYKAFKTQFACHFWHGTRTIANQFFRKRQRRCVKFEGILSIQRLSRLLGPNGFMAQSWTGRNHCSDAQLRTENKNGFPWSLQINIGSIRMIRLLIKIL